MRRLEPSSPPDATSCYKSAVDDDDDEHLVTATSVNTEDEFVDFEDVEQVDALVNDNCHGSQSDCTGNSPLPAPDSFLSGHSASPVSKELLHALIVKEFHQVVISLYCSVYIYVS